LAEERLPSRPEPGGQPLQVVPVGKLVERVEQNHDSALAYVIGGNSSMPAKPPVHSHG